MQSAQTRAFLVTYESLVAHLYKLPTYGREPCVQAGLIVVCAQARVQIRSTHSVRRRLRLRRRTVPLAISHLACRWHYHLGTKEK